ncbi:unnamed protein product [Sphagnum balticum]
MRSRFSSLLPPGGHSSVAAPVLLSSAPRARSSFYGATTATNSPVIAPGYHPLFPCFRDQIGRPFRAPGSLLREGQEGQGEAQNPYETHTYSSSYSTSRSCRSDPEDPTFMICRETTRNGDNTTQKEERVPAAQASILGGFPSFQQPFTQNQANKDFGSRQDEFDTLLNVLFSSPFFSAPAFLDRQKDRGNAGQFPNPLSIFNRRFSISETGSLRVSATVVEVRDTKMERSKLNRVRSLRRSTVNTIFRGEMKKITT